MVAEWFTTLGTPPWLPKLGGSTLTFPFNLSWYRHTHMYRYTIQIYEYMIICIIYKYNTQVIKQNIPSRELTYPTKREKETHRLKSEFWWDMLVPKECILKSMKPRKSHSNTNSGDFVWKNFTVVDSDSSTFSTWMATHSFLLSSWSWTCPPAM